MGGQCFHYYKIHIYKIIREQSQQKICNLVCEIIEVVITLRAFVIKISQLRLSEHKQCEL